MASQGVRRRQKASGRLSWVSVGSPLDTRWIPVGSPLDSHTRDREEFSD